jgi:DNA processing protein
LNGLYVVGSLEGLSAPTVALVGSRAPSEAGRQLARSTASALARAGVCVISGLAHGIDAAAHEGALEAGAPTIGVLGGGHGHFYPPRNRPLAEAMLACGGAVVSPFAPEEPAHPWQFLQRNGIIAALADAVVVVEAAARSGSLNTAGWAADLGIPVFAFPGDVDRPKVAGCLGLIRDGAVLVRNADDILEGMGLRASGSSQKAEATNAACAQTPLEREVLSRLAHGEASLDELLPTLHASTAQLATTLVQLEIRGCVERRDGNRFVLMMN